MSKEDQAYTELENWLKKCHTGYVNNLICKNVEGSGRGLFAAREMKEGEVLLEIPPSAMLNPLTLRGKSTIPEHLFPSSKKSARPLKKVKTNGDACEAGPSRPKVTLDTTQLLTLHLAMTRYKDGAEQETWREYIASTPASFRPWHSLTWYYPPPGEEAWWNKVIELLPKGVRRKLDDVKKRYEADKAILRDVLKDEAELSSYREEVEDEDILWAWLNVNTRTVSIPLDLPSPSETHNHTLVPVLDMINHASSPSVNRPLQIALSGGVPQKRSYSSALAGSSSPSSASTSGGVPGKIGFRLVTPPGGLREGEEVTFEYGAHCNGTLFAEYGFLLRPTRRKDKVVDVRISNGELESEADDEPSENPWLNTKHGEVDLEHLVNDILDGVDHKKEKIELITDMGYLHRYTLHTYPYPPYPSHSLIMALRIIHLTSAELESKSKPLKSFAISYISPDNEILVNKCLADMLEIAQAERIAATKKMRGMKVETTANQAAQIDAIDLILSLWEEEEAIVDSVLSRLRSGDINW